MNLKEWLFQPCDLSDLLPSKDQHGKIIEGVYYMPKPVVDGKLREMEETYGGKIDHTSFEHFFHNLRDGSMMVSGTASIHLYGHGLSYRLFGSSTFREGKFGENENYGATLLTLCITQALSRKFPQFGSLLLKEDLEVYYPPEVKPDESLNRATNTIKSLTKSFKK